MTRETFSWSRWVGIIVKEFIQLKRDRLTFGMIIGIPVLQLILFGYAINADPTRRVRGPADLARSRTPAQQLGAAE